MKTSNAKYKLPEVGLTEKDLSTKRLYKEGYVLRDHEYLLKIRDEGTPRATGFLTKFTKKGEMPVAFKDWGNSYGNVANLPVYVVEETPRKGWKLKAWRFGMSQNWASVVHPHGFTLEIYLQQFLEVVQENTIVNGEIVGEFKWEANKLIKS